MGRSMRKRRTKRRRTHLLKGFIRRGIVSHLPVIFDGLMATITIEGM